MTLNKDFDSFAKTIRATRGDSRLVEALEWYETFEDKRTLAKLIRELAEHQQQLNKPLSSVVGNKIKRRLLQRFNFIDEEMEELGTAIRTLDFAEIADALVDILYFVYGTAVELQLPIDDFFAEVHRANMRKVDENGNVLRDPDNGGKIIKPAGWKPPEFSREIGYWATLLTESENDEQWTQLWELLGRKVVGEVSNVD